MHDKVRTANLLGATALAVNDLALAGVRDAAGISASGAAALVVLSASPRLAVTELGRRVGLSQSAAARMVDSLQSANLVVRRPGVGREIGVELTTAGDEAAGRLLATRAETLTGLVGALEAPEQETLAELLAKLLTGIYGQVGRAELLCRLCDRHSCADGAVCPVGQAERDHLDGRT